MDYAMNLLDTMPVDEETAPHEKLKEIEATLAELDIYLARYPEDEIARIQHKQFSQKREALAGAPSAAFCGYAASNADCDQAEPLNA